MPANEQLVDVGGRTLRLRNLDKVLYPSTGTTKGELLHYLTSVSGLLLPHLKDRPATRKRWPDGVESSTTFFEKNVPRGAPSWLRDVTLPAPGSTKDREMVTYPLIDDLAGLVWAANLAALELHVPQWRVGPRGAAKDPDLLVIDLDPGAPAGLPQCAEVAWAVREKLEDDGLVAFPVTSGGKGMQLYAAVSGKQDATTVREYAHRLAEGLEREMPRLVVSRMAKALRKNKVLLDWSQNHSAKTTICPFSPRGRERPTVAAPRTWDELDDPGALRQLEFGEVLDRVPDLGDPLAELLPTGNRAGKGPRVPTS
ncbi:non-homologous end-joining DNA ligase [Kineosporia succinea]|uniref:Bifunctional non-homologous end joining protein LigD n=1 Tax=Kineosporia succinea TaxID=84632 RepID=A0ABT9P262_9ACTN|nr:non-homologous end-joining DNA ligase [Kineosporia succinea]MDP9826651.1 bifunctional non-homologous end joining protein LigD [Kineosporia succinea]